MKKRQGPRFVIDDPHVSTRVDAEDTPQETPQETDVRVSRELGDCDFCDATDLQVVRSYDHRVYKGWACPMCILTGKACDRFAPSHKAMRPMVFVARALRGDQPFKDLLKAADIQRKNPKATASMKAKMAKTGSAIGKFGNRKQRRAQAKRVRLAKLETKKRGDDR